MKQKKILRLFSFFLAIVLCMSAMPLSVFAEENSNEQLEDLILENSEVSITETDETIVEESGNEQSEELGDEENVDNANTYSSYSTVRTQSVEKLNTYETVPSTLAPGVTQTINYAYRDDGKYVKYFVAVVDLSNPEVGLHATYADAQSTNTGVSKMTSQVAAMTELHTNPDDADNYIENYAIVAGVNGDGYNTDTGKPSGAHVMNGVSGFGITKSANSPWFALFEDGTAACGRADFDWDTAVAEHGAVKEAIGGFQLLMKDGVVYEPSTDAKDMTKGGSNYWRPGFNYPCSFLGVTYDNKVVLLNCDGNNAGGSAGFDYDYTLEVAKELGLKDMLCLDGGGSATYLSRPEGQSEVVVISNPSDGSERAVANGLVVYSTTPSSDVFERSNLSTKATHYTPYSEIAVNASGVSPAGTPAEIPADVEWTLSDNSFGTISDGVFTSNGTLGTVELQMRYQGVVVGQVEVQIVNPTAISFTQESMVVPFGKNADVAIEAFYYDDVRGVTFPVTIKAPDFTFSFSEEGAGSIDGFNLSAPTDESVASVTLTAEYKYFELDSFSINVSYGKASEIVWDFENGDVSNWLGLDQAMEWVEEKGLVDKSPLTSAHGNSIKEGTTNVFYMYGGNAPQTNTAYTFLATAENGQVKNGNYALGLTLDETSYNQYGSWEYNILFNVEGQTVLRDVANGLNATTLGMWVYLPEDLIGMRYADDQAGFAMQFQLYGGSSADNVTGFGGHFLLQDTGLSLYNTTNSDATEVGRWVYMTADISSKDYVSLTNPESNTWREPCFIRFYFKHLEPKKYSFYFDDFTLDYSSAVEDRDAPIISNVTYTSATVFDPTSFTKACPDNEVFFQANIADKSANNMSGLDYSSAKIYVDGIALEKVTASGSTLTSDEVILTNGTHEVIFEIADNMGTITRNVEILTISGDETIWIDGHNDSGELAEYDSVYYMDLKVAEASEISNVVTEISLNTANTWELPYLTVAEGFSVEYEFVKLTNSIKFTITKNADCNLKGEQTLISVPVRLWSWPDDAYDVTSKAGLSKNLVTAKTMSTAGGRPIVPIDFEVEYGLVNYTPGYYDGYTGTFYDYFTTETKIQDEKYDWHLTHTVTSLADEEATCTEVGYTGRTYCDVCKSVVEWGTIEPATGHNYEMLDGALQCACGQRFNGTWTDGKEYVDGVVAPDGWFGDVYYKDGKKLTGVQLIDDYYYNFGENGVCANQTKFTGKFYNESVKGYCYAISGELQSGWYLVDGSWNYFRWAEKTAITGTYKFANGNCAGITYVFDDEGNLTNGVWHTREDGNIQYFYGPDCYKWDNNMLQEIDGKTYCFDKDGYLYRGYQIIKIGAFAPEHLYHFDDVTGELHHAYENDTGIVYAGENVYYLIEGIIQRSLGLIKVDGAQYYVRGNGLLAMGKFYIGAGYTGCDHLKPGYYDFGEDGKFVGPWVDQSLNGVQTGEDGELHYYVNGIEQKGLGMITIDGSEYYVRGNGLLAVGKYYIGAGYTGCDHLKPGYYDFGEDGKFVGPWTSEDAYTGVKADTEGKLHYYVNGIEQKGLGMITIDGSEYYVRGNGLLAVGKYYIGAGYTGCDHLKPGYYDFGEDGKFVGPWVDQSLNGVQTGEDGELHYYVNGIEQKGLGMITIDGSEYYVRGNGLLAVGKYYIGAGYTGCDHLKPGYYDFGEDGKFVGPWTSEDAYTGVKADAEGKLHYYVNDIIQYGLGLINIDGSDYYVRGNGLLAVDKYYVGAGYTGCSHLKPGFYDFGEDGKFVGPWVD